MTLPETFKSFLKHLDELRSRVLKSLGVFFIAALVCFNYANDVLAWLVKPAGHLVFTSPSGGFKAITTVTVIMAVLVSAPFILYQLWAFIASALKPNERRFIFLFAPLSLVFFCLGVAFAFFGAVPVAYKFLTSFATDYMSPLITVDSYMSFLASMVIAFGVTFQLPLILAVLAKMGIASPEFLRQKRRHAIMIILIVAAIATPPDVVSWVLLAVPLLILYEAGIFLVKICYKHKTL